TVQAHIETAQHELARLRAVPTPPSDIEERVREYVAGLARPRVSGIAAGQQLRVEWPDNVIAVLALLLPGEMTRALPREVERQSNTPLPPTARKQRIAALGRTIDELQRQVLALGGDVSELPPEIVLGVRVARKETKRVA